MKFIAVIELLSRLSLLDFEGGLQRSDSSLREYQRSLM